MFLTSTNFTMIMIVWTLDALRWRLSIDKNDVAFLRLHSLFFWPWVRPHLHVFHWLFCNTIFCANKCGNFSCTLHSNIEIDEYRLAISFLSKNICKKNLRERKRNILYRDVQIFFGYYRVKELDKQIRAFPASQSSTSSLQYVIAAERHVISHFH